MIENQARTMSRIRLIKHAKGAPGLRLLGLGPNLCPARGLHKLQKLLDKYAFWAKGRSKSQLKSLLAGSSHIVSLWRDNRLVGFGRATSDGIFRAVLWDIVVDGDLQGLGLGKQVVKALLEAPEIKSAQKIYLMTTNSANFYKQLGFETSAEQELLVFEKNIKNKL